MARRLAGFGEQSVGVRMVPPLFFFYFLPPPPKDLEIVNRLILAAPLLSTELYFWSRRHWTCSEDRYVFFSGLFPSFLS